LATEDDFAHSALASLADAIVITDLPGRIVYLNPAAERMLCAKVAQLRHHPFSKLGTLRDSHTGIPIDAPAFADPPAEGSTVRVKPASYIISRSDSTTALAAAVVPMLDTNGQIVGAVWKLSEVGAEHEIAAALSTASNDDASDVLVDQSEFERRLQRMLDAARIGQPQALLYLDVDQLNLVRDNCGHRAAHQLIQQVALLLSKRLRTRDTLAYLESGAFGVLVEHCPTDEAMRIADEFLDTLQDFRFAWQSKQFHLGASIGLVPITEHYESCAQLLAAADAACYQAQGEGRNRVAMVESPSTSAAALRHSDNQWLSKIQKALTDGSFSLYFQPILPINHRDHAGPHGEILLCMETDQGQIIPPGAFIPVAERYSQMVEIDRWVVENALRLLSARNQRTATYAINISGQSLSDCTFLNFVIDQLESSGVAPMHLCFEITETAAISDFANAIRFISSLKTRGCRFALDDFGTGLSSFSYLKNLPVNYLKIDGCFVRDLTTDPIDEAMVTAIHQIGHVMGLKTIAESVENAGTLEKLRAIGVDYAQGYGIAHPQRLDAIV
jgi:diguanylate cyclase (GGDEF)-like protein